MGADIHIYAEVRYGSCEPWQLFPEHKYYPLSAPYDSGLCDIYCGRNYNLFSTLSGVRGSYDCTTPYHGLPLNLSPQLQGEWDSNGYHTCNHLSLDEWRNAIKDYDRQFKNEMRRQQRYLRRLYREGAISKRELTQDLKDISYYSKKACKGKKKIHDIFCNWSDLEDQLENYKKKYPKSKAAKRNLGIFDCYDLPSFYDIIPYLKKWIKNNTYICPDGLFSTEPEIRIVYWFDS